MPTISIPPGVGAALGALLSVIVVVVALSGCGAAKPLLVDLTSAACTDIIDAQDAGLPPDLVSVGCKDVSGAVVNLILPRKAYLAARAGGDAGVRDAGAE